MRNFGIIGCLLFIITTIIGGYLFPNYSHISNLISESYAVDATYNFQLRFFGYIPSAIFTGIFVLYFNSKTPKSNLKTIACILILVSYSFATLICAIFNCDAGCNPNFINPTISQAIHNLSGSITYLIMPFAMLFVGMDFKKFGDTFFYKACIFLFLISLFFIIILFNNFDSDYKGLIQRVIEFTFILWFVFATKALKKSY
ncbi:MAG: DUF998 domain-containing protein [Bacteroidota bacterium]